MCQPLRKEHMAKSKSYQIPKCLFVDAWKKVKQNRGSPGVDGQTIEEFEERLQDNLYKLWNRMSSGSYFPVAVRLCEIPKIDGKVRTLGIPTVSDRVAQMVVKMMLEPKIDPKFHQDSYGYRPGKSAIEAVGKARERCWQMNWVIDLDIKGFFDNIDHDLMLKAVKKHTQEPWILMYVERWLKAPGKDKNGLEVVRIKGTPQGGVISPLLANLFLHYGFDCWMVKNFPDILFERYADDVVVHCYTEKQALFVKEGIGRRLKECGLTLHPGKTKITYCKDVIRKGRAENTKFDFLGYEFRARCVRNSRRGHLFVGFNPAISPKARKAINQKIRSWKLTKWTMVSMEEIAKKINSVVRGWINYYGAYSKSSLRSVLRQVEFAIAKWAMRKYKKFHRKWVFTLRWLKSVSQRSPQLFAHWTV